MRVCVLACLLALALSPTAARAAAPINDNFADARVIDAAALPFSDAADPSSGATLEPGEPGQCGLYGGSVWYAITPPSDMVLGMSVSWPANMQVYQGTSFADLQGQGCGQSINLHAAARVTYYIQIYGYWSTTLNVTEIVPPAGDDFAAAQTIDPASLPFHDTQSGAGASPEANEPGACAPFGPLASWWYAFTPTVSRSYTVSAGGGPAISVAAFRGSALSNLTMLACGYYGGRSSFAATAGTTYYVQVNDPYHAQFGPTSMSLEVAPDPVANFGWSPGDASTVDTVTFFDQSSDPGGNAIQSSTWEFGDGTTIPAGQPATHRYTTDGDYPVKLTITTTDGRTASVTRTVSVRTHDVGITTFSVPQTAKPDQSKTLTVGVANSRYPERVTVQLLKSVAGGGFQPVGQLTQSVPARGRNRATDFPFSYTFTADDATAGSVTFQAVATLADARDALTGDNTIIALPTKVHA